MKKLISMLASIPFSVAAQQFPEVSVCFHTLKTVISAYVCGTGYKNLLAMDLKTHACSFHCKQPIRISRVGYQAWKSGITYQISLWQYGRSEALATCLVSPENTGTIQFFALEEPVTVMPGVDYYISRTYVGGGPHQNIRDYIGWLSNRGGAMVCPLEQQEITLSNGFFSDDENPLQSEDMSNITTHTLLPLIDFEYSLQ